MRQLACSSSCLNYFFILSWHDWLSYMYTSKLQHNYISYSKITIRPSSAIPWGTKNITGPKNPGHKHWDPGHSSNTFLMTIHQSSSLQDPTMGNWGISKYSTTSRWPETKTSKWHYKLKCVQQQPKNTTPKHLSAIDFLLNQLLLQAISPSPKPKKSHEMS